VQRARNKIKDDLDKLNPTKRREALRQLFVAQARTIEEREAINKDFADPKNTTDKLQDRFLGRFDELANEQVGDEADKIQSINRRRTEIAHLLYNLPSGTNRQEALLAHQRLMIVIGQRAFVREAEAQALALREIAHRIQLLTVDDRELFERQYGAQRDRALYLAYELTRKQKELADTNTRIASSTDQIEGNAEKKIQGRKNQIKELNELLAKTTEETEKALKEQHDLEQRLFDLHKEVGSLIDANRKLEREIRNQELGRTRGGRP
jgi:myosin heavy subunit